MKNLTMKEINEKYVNRIIGSLENDKELWTREVMGGMGFVDYYSPNIQQQTKGLYLFLIGTPLVLILMVNLLGRFHFGCIIIRLVISQDN